MVAAVSQGRMASDFDLSQVRRVVGPEEIVAMQLGTAQVTSTTR
jgi:MoxR-like ATPase